MTSEKEFGFTDAERRGLDDYWFAPWWRTSLTPSKVTHRHVVIDGQVTWEEIPPSPPRPGASHMYDPWKGRWKPIDRVMREREERRVKREAKFAATEARAKERAANRRPLTEEQKARYKESRKERRLSTAVTKVRLVVQYTTWGYLGKTGSRGRAASLRTARKFKSLAELVAGAERASECVYTARLLEGHKAVAIEAPFKTEDWAEADLEEFEECEDYDEE